MPIPAGFPATRNELVELPDQERKRLMDIMFRPRSLDEIEWSMTMKWAQRLPRAIEGFQSARSEMERLLQQGYVDVGILNGSPIGAMNEEMTGSNPLRAAVQAMAPGSYKIVDYWFGDDDTRCHVFVHGMRGEQMRAKYAAE